MKEIENERLLDRFHELVRQKSHTWMAFSRCLKEGKKSSAEMFEKDCDKLMCRIFNIKEILRQKLAC